MGVMLDCTLSTEQLAELRVGHRCTRDKREADRIKAVVLLATGWSVEEEAEVLLVDPNTVRAHFKRYREDGLEGLRRVGEGVGGSIGLLDTKQLAQLDAHLQTNLYLSAKAVGHWAKETFGVSYTESGMTAVLHRLGYVYKKPRLVPGKADREAQEQFLETYDNIRNTKGQDDPIIFMDATHPQHNPVLAGGWIKRGEELEIPTNTGRRRVNINGAIDLERLEPAKAVQAYLKTSRIKLIFLPPYAPNLNLIERLWKFFKKKVLYNRYYETFGEFRSACETFFQNPRNYHCELRSLLTANFEIIG